MTDSNSRLKITSATVTIEAPMHSPVELFKGRDIHQWEAIFIGLRDNEKNIAYKRNYDRCRALLKYAYSLWGDLKEVSNGQGSIIFTFKFDGLDELYVFEKDLPKAMEVEGVTM